METEDTKQPYFHLSKNEHGKMWLMYKPEGGGRYKCWEPITGEFWNEFEKLLQERNKAIDECIRLFDCNEYYYGDIVQNMLESLKVKPQ